MQKQWITLIILLICCSQPTNDHQYSENYQYKKNTSKIYSNFLRGNKERKEVLTENNSANTEKTKEPLPSFNSQPITNQKESTKKSSGIFSFFSRNSNEEIHNENRKDVCEELLDINKIVVIDQNEKLIEISIEKDNMLQQIRSLEKNIINMNREDNERIQTLETEIDRLNWLIKILSSEIK